MAKFSSAPIYVSWNYTYACNLNCSHCYSRATSYPAELDTQGYLSIADQLAEACVFKVGLGGGEPLIRKDCYRIVRQMSDAGIETNITTNGWFVNADTAKRLADAGLSVLYVSVDSPVEVEHDRFRRMPGSYRRAINAVKFTAEAGIRVKFSTVVSTLNARALSAVATLAAEAGAGGVEFKRFRPAGNGMTSNGTWALQDADEGAIKEEIGRLKKTSPLDIALIYGADPDGETDSGCPCGIRSICIRPNGDVSPCAYGEAVIGNLMQERLVHMWRDSPILNAMRSGGGCVALTEQPFPSNPYLHEQPQTRVVQ